MNDNQKIIDWFNNLPYEERVKINEQIEKQEELKAFAEKIDYLARNGINEVFYELDY